MTSMRLAMLSWTNLSCLPNTWDRWTEHIMSKRDTYKFTKAAMMKVGSGAPVSATRGFSVPVADVSSIRKAMEDRDCDRFSVRGETFIVKTSTSDCVVGFNGAEFCVVCRSADFYILVIGKSRSKRDAAVNWLKQLTTNLKGKGF